MYYRTASSLGANVFDRLAEQKLQRARLRWTICSLIPADVLADVRRIVDASPFGPQPDLSDASKAWLVANATTLVSRLSVNKYGVSDVSILVAFIKGCIKNPPCPEGYFRPEVSPLDAARGALPICPSGRRAVPGPNGCFLCAEQAPVNCPAGWYPDSGILREACGRTSLARHPSNANCFRCAVMDAPPEVTTVPYDPVNVLDGMGAWWPNASATVSSNTSATIPPTAPKCPKGQWLVTLPDGTKNCCYTEAVVRNQDGTASHKIRCRAVA